MSKLLLVAALAALASHASAQELYDYPVNAPATFPDMSFREECQAVLAPQNTPEITVTATGCARTVEDYLIKIGRFDTEQQPVPNGWTPQIRCGAQLILNHITEPKTVADILSAEFDKACNSHATM